MKKTCFTDICTLIMGQSPDSSSYNTNYEGLPFYQGNSDFGELHPVPRVWCSEPKKIAQENDILISVRAPIGDLNIANKKCCIGRGLAAIRIINSDNVDLTYLYHFFESKRTYLQEKGTGSTFKAINKDSLINFVIPLPSIKEQESISQELSALHLLIKGKKTQLFSLDELVKSRFIEMFGDPILNEKNWEIQSISNVCEKILGGGTPSKKHPEFYIGSIPWVTPKDMKTSTICDSIDHINEMAIENSTTNLISQSSVLMVIRSGILKHTLPVAINSTPVTINQDMKAFILGDKILPEFLLYCFKAMESDILGKVRCVTADNIDFKDFLNRQIIIPPIELQNEFAEFVKLIDKSKFIVQQQIKDLQELLDSKMDEYFR